MKRLFALILALALFMLSSCGGDSTSSAVSPASHGYVSSPASVTTDVSSEEAPSDVSAAPSSEAESVISSEASSEAFSQISSQGGTSSYEEHIPVDGEVLNDRVVFPSRPLDPSKPMVAITFDDGPSRRGTERILDTLEKYGVVATFFDVGKNVEAYPDIVKREAALGCEVASHSYSHPNFNELSASALKNELSKANKAFENVLGYKPVLVRPPYGSCSEKVAASIDQAVVTWSVDTLDWDTRNAEKIIKSVKSVGNLDGKCILMHGIYDETADAVEEIVPYLINEGYQLVTVSELIIYGKNDDLVAGRRYRYSYF